VVCLCLAANVRASLTILRRVACNLKGPAMPIETINRTELAKLLGYSTKAVDNWRLRGLPHDTSGKHPRYVVADVVAWLRARDVEDAVASGKRPDGAIDLEELRKRKALADTEISELALEEARALVVPFTIVIEEVEDCFLRIRSKLLSMKTRYSGRWARITTAPKMKAAVEAAVFEILDELTDVDDLAGVARKGRGASKAIRPAPAQRPAARRPSKAKTSA
jgi:phage terminase Nu1 subunit (DNA packaging protein)